MVLSQSFREIEEVQIRDAGCFMSRNYEVSKLGYT